MSGIDGMGRRAIRESLISHYKMVKNLGEEVILPQVYLERKEKLSDKKVVNMRYYLGDYLTV
jgi:hypothetical protein